MIKREIINIRIVGHSILTLLAVDRVVALDHRRIVWPDSDDSDQHHDY
jgi:hypothetical protein